MLGGFIWCQLSHDEKRGQLLLRVVGLLLRRGLGVAGVRLPGEGRPGVATLSWSGLVGHVGQAVLPVSIGVVAHGHLMVPRKENETLSTTVVGFSRCQR